MRTEPSRFQATLIVATAGLVELELWWQLQGTLATRAGASMPELGGGMSDRYTEGILLARACITAVGEERSDAAAIAQLATMTVGQLVQVGDETPILMLWRNRLASEVLAELFEQAASEFSGFREMEPFDRLAANLSGAKATFLQTLSEDLG